MEFALWFIISYLLLSIILLLINNSGFIADDIKVLYYPLQLILEFILFLKHQLFLFKTIFMNETIHIFGYRGCFNSVRFEGDEDFQKSLNNRSKHLNKPMGYFYNDIEKRIQKLYGNFWYNVLLWRRKKYIK